MHARHPRRDRASVGATALFGEPVDDVATGERFAARREQIAQLVALIPPLSPESDDHGTDVTSQVGPEFVAAAREGGGFDVDVSTDHGIVPVGMFDPTVVRAQPKETDPAHGFVPGDSTSSPDTVEVTGFGFGTFRTFSHNIGDFTSQAVKLKYKQGKLVEPPNMMTALEETFRKQVSKALFPKGRTLLGVARTDSAKQYAWLNVKKASDIAKGLNGEHSGQAYPFDYLRDLAPVMAASAT